MASRVKINSDRLAQEIGGLLREYTGEVVERMDIAGDRISRSAVQRLRKVDIKRTGAYRKSWQVQKQGRFGQPAHYVIHNKEHYRLTHLLEKGHANRDGTRTPGRPHLAPIEQEVIAEYLSAVEEAIKGGA